MAQPTQSQDDLLAEVARLRAEVATLRAMRAPDAVGIGEPEPILQEALRVATHAARGRPAGLPDRDAADARAREVADSMPQIVWTADPDGRVNYYNRRWYEHTGAPTEAAAGGAAGWTPYVHPDDLPNTTAAWYEAIATGRPMLVNEHRLLDARTGEYRWRLARAEPVRDADGSIVQWVGTSTDLHAMKLAEAALREKSERLEAALTASGTGTFRWDIRTDALTWDANLDRLFGLPPGQTAQSLEAFLALVHPDDRQGIIDRCARCRDAGADFDMEFRVVLPDGSVRWLDDKGRTFFDADGRPAYMTGACVDVTERRRRAHERSEREARYRSLFDSLPLIAWVLSPDGQVEYFNQHWTRFTGLSTHPDGLSWLDAAHPDDRQRVRDVRTAAIARGEAYEVEMRFRGIDDRYIWQLCRVVPLRDERGRIFNWLGTATDIDAIRRADQAVRASESRFRVLAEAMPQIVWVADAAGEVEYLNERWAQFTGRPVADSMGSVWTELIHPHDLPATRAAWLAAVRSGTPYDTEYRLRRHDGEYRWHLARGTPTRGDTGEVVRWLGTCTDVHEQKLSFETMRGQREQLALTFAAAGAGAFEWNIQTGHNWWSPELETLYGLPVGSFEGSYEAWTRFCLPEDLPAAEAEMRRSLQTGAFSVDFRIRRPDGDVRWVHARARVLHDPDGRPFRMVGINLDVTDRKRAEEDAGRAREEAEAASRAKDEFLAALSHELRTPLTPVLMTAQMLEADATLPDAVREDMRVIRRNVELETRLIDDLLDLTRIARGKLQLHQEAVDVHDLLRHAVETCSDEAAAQKRLRVEMDLAARDHVAWGDGARLSQVFWNVLKNAFKFTPSNGRIVVRTSNPPAGGIAVSVTDSGVGIEPDVLPHVFTAFEQGGPGVTRRFGGLGLGLAICRALTEMHGGRIRAESAGKWQGATFVIELPSVERSSSPDAPAVPDEAGSDAVAAGTSGDPPGNRILLVEDHEQTARVLCRLLAVDGLDVRWADGVAAALAAAAKAGPFDLVVSDLGLPDGSGLELMRQLRDRHGLNGIALTGYGMEQDFAASAAAGFVEHLVKPVSRDRLAAAIRRHLRAPG